jgi:DNA-binding MarR family transcriptional regulator
MKRDLPSKSVRPAEAAKAVAPTTARPSGKPQATDNWDARLGFLMHDVSRLRRGVFDDFMKPVGLTRSQWWILAHLARHDGMIQSDLANVLDIGKAALGGLIDRLEASKFIERRPDESDRRVKRIYLTTKGSQMIVEIKVRSHEMSERILAGLDVDARHKLVDMLSLVKRNLQAVKSANANE